MSRRFRLPTSTMLVGLALAARGAVAQDQPNERPTPRVAQPAPDRLATDPVLFLTSSRQRLKWDEPAEPVKIVGPIYFVGTKGLGAFLITGADGHVLLYTGMPGSGPLIEESIKKLGFRPEDVKLILTGHAHVDHVGGHAYLKNATGAQVAMLREEVELFESGGALDFQYGEVKEFAFEPAKVDVVLHDQQEIKLGDLSVTVFLTPGHTRGSASYLTKVTDGGKTYTVVFPDGTGINPGYRVGGENPSYPGIADNYRRTFRVLAALTPDVWLTPHNADDGFDAKRAGGERGRRCLGRPGWLPAMGRRAAGAICSGCETVVGPTALRRAANARGRSARSGATPSRNIWIIFGNLPISPKTVVRPVSAPSYSS